MSVNKSACILGCSFLTGNMGVSALAYSLIENILSIDKDYTINFLVGHSKNVEQKICINGDDIKVNIINYRLSPKAYFRDHLIWILFISVLYRCIPIKVIKKRLINNNDWVRALEEADFIGDIRGGDSFSDIYGFSRFLIGVIPVITAQLLKKSVVLLPQTYGPYKHKLTNVIAKNIIRRSYKAYSRDIFSINLIKDMVNTKDLNDHLLFCPDIAFSLYSETPEKIDIEPGINLKDKGYSTYIGLNVNGLMYNGGYNKNNMFNLKLDYHDLLDGIICNFCRDSNIHIVLVPHTYGGKGNVNSDPVAIETVFKKYYSRFSNLHVLKGEYNQSEVKGIIKHFDFFIGSRMHSCIAALSQEIPTIGVAYSRKFIGVFNSIDLDEMVIDGSTVNNDEAIDIIEKLYIDRDHKKKKLSKVIPEIKETIKNVFETILL